MDVPCLYTLKETIYGKKMYATPPSWAFVIVYSYVNNPAKKNTTSMTRSTDSQNRIKATTYVLQILFSAGI